MSKTYNGHIHFVGVCGVAMAPLAVLYKQMGYKVTGSDVGIYPPLSTYLDEQGIKIQLGYKTSHMNEKPDLIVASSFVTKQNPEVEFGFKNGIPVKGFAELIPDLLEKNDSVVVAGNFGKTSISALIAWTLELYGLKPNFLIGGIPLNFGTGIRRSESARCSVLEGDEYVNLQWDRRPKFSFYHPKFLVLTSVDWDHKNIYLTKEEYITSFREYITSMRPDGMVFVPKSNADIDDAVRDTAAQIIKFDSRVLPAGLEPPFAGRIWQMNAAAAYSMLNAYGVPDGVIANAFNSFRNVKRRQEKRFDRDGIVIFDDFSHSPGKVSGGLQAITEMVGKGNRIYVVYEPGDRSELALNSEDYKECFSGAEEVLLPRLSSATQKARDSNMLLAENISKSYIRSDGSSRVKVFSDDDELVSYLVLKLNENKPVTAVFMSQRAFRGMIEEVIDRLERIK